MDVQTRAFVATVMARSILPAIEDAQNRHGILTSDHCRAITIMTEEVGEAAAETLGLTRATSANVFREDCRLAAIKELSQVAAVAILMIVNLEREIVR